MLFLGLGAMFAAAGKDGAKAPALFSILHGVGLLVMIVAGIGQAHKLGYGWPMWLILKIGCWLVIAVLPTLAKKKIVPWGVALLFALALGGTAVWLAIAKPLAE